MNTILSSLADRIGLRHENGENTEQRCAVAILCDCSRSMFGPKIDELNSGLQMFASEMRNDPLASLRVEPLILSFASEVSPDRTWTTADEFHPPNLRAEGWTKLCTAVIEGLDAIEERKQHYRSQPLSYFRPWLVMLSDGEPTDLEMLPEAIRRAEEAETLNKCSIYCIGVENADMGLLARLSPARAPLLLQGTKFAELFRWLSDSLKTHSNTRMGQQAALPSVAGWATTP